LHTLKRHAPLLLALGVFTALLVRMLLKVLNINDGHLVYALDDAYIHMSIAKNFATQGVWGVTAEAFTSSTSSPLWTLLIAMSYVIFGVNTLSPFVFNIIFAVGLLVSAHVILRRYGAPPWLGAVALLAITVGVPLNPLIFLGMEHLLHALVALLLLFTAGPLIAAPPTRGWIAAAVLLAALTTSVRYEGFFLLAALCGLLLLRRRFSLALLLGAAGTLPATVYGMIAAVNGWPPVPVTLLLKSDDKLSLLERLTSPAGLVTFFGDAVKLIVDLRLFAALLLATLVLAAVAWWQRNWDAVAVVLIAFAGMLSGHFLLVSDEGLFLRYDAYLVLVGVVVMAVGVARLLPALPGSMHWRRNALVAPVLGVVALVGLIAFVNRFQIIRNDYPMLAATNNIYNQQYQMGRFLDRYYTDATVVVHDIGAVNYLADLQAVDIWGLGSLPVAEARIADHYQLNQLEALTAEAEIAVVYRHWLRDLVKGYPEGWVEVGEWGTPNVVVLGGQVVTFYALQPGAVVPLRENLHDFRNELPDMVIQEGAYLDVDG
jgi:hypothetical protein